MASQQIDENQKPTHYMFSNVFLRKPIDNSKVACYFGIFRTSRDWNAISHNTLSARTRFDKCGWRFIPLERNSISAKWSRAFGVRIFIAAEMHRANVAEWESDIFKAAQHTGLLVGCCNAIFDLHRVQCESHRRAKYHLKFDRISLHGRVLDANAEWPCKRCRCH